MPKYDSHLDVLLMLSATQEADLDNRDMAREAHLFIDKRDGQWEPYWWSANRNNPRYTFDMAGPIVDQVAGEMEMADFGIRIIPAGGDATKDDAKLIDGMIRNIESMSNAVDIYNQAGRNMVTCGFDAWQIKQEYVDEDSFDQDLVISRIANAIDSVWFGAFKEPDGSDSPWCIVLEAVEHEEYFKRYPEGSGQSVRENRLAEAYYHKHDQVIIGQLYYREKQPRELLLMSTGMVLDDTESTRQVLDDMAALGITVKQRRKRESCKVHSRLFDGGGWLTDAQETVFNQIPVIPTIGNFKIFENKLLYRGVVEKLMDSGRVFNYAKSREIGEGALAPRGKYWMTQKQAAGFEDTLETLNTNSDPVQFFNVDQDNPGAPQQQGGAQVNPALRGLAEDMRAITQQTAGMFAASMGDNPNLQSGIAIEKLQDRGSVGSTKYFQAQERAICRTARILVDALPRVYDTERMQRVLKEDGSFDQVMLNRQMYDEQSREMVTINDMSVGKYDVSCSAGKNYQNRQQETVAAITEIAQYDPTVITESGDILFNNISAPGMDLIAERKREQLLKAGIIPFDQMNDEEKEEQQQRDKQEAAPDPLMVAAEAEAGKARAQADKVMVDGQIAQAKEERERFTAQTSAQADAASADLAQKEFDFKQFLAIQQLQGERQQQMIDGMLAQAEMLKLIREAMGADAAIAPGVEQAFVGQAQNVQQAVAVPQNIPALTAEGPQQLAYNPMTGEMRADSIN